MEYSAYLLFNNSRNPIEVLGNTMRTYYSQTGARYHHELFEIIIPNGRNIICNGSYRPILPPLIVFRVDIVSYNDLMDRIPGIQKQKAKALRNFYDSDFVLNQPEISKFINGKASNPLHRRIRNALIRYFHLR